jgi:recombination protein RecA
MSKKSETKEPGADKAPPKTSKVKKVTAVKKRVTSAKKKPLKASALEKSRKILGTVGKGALNHFVPLDKRSLKDAWPHVSTGNIRFDYLIGGKFDAKGQNACPGVPRRGITNVYGPEHCGKTSFCLHIAAEVCRQGGCVAYIDYEHVLDVRYAASLGVPVSDVDRFALFQPETLEQGVAAILAMASEGVDLIVLDSVGAAMPREVFDLSVEDITAGERPGQGIGLLARRWSELLPKIQHRLAQGQTALLAVSQTRSSINSTQNAVQGGNGWKFFSMVRIELRNMGYIYDNQFYNALDRKKEKGKSGAKVKASIKKSKISPTYGWEVELELIPGRGFDPLRAAMTVAASHGIIEKRGSHYYWTRRDGTEIHGNGKESFMQLLYAAKGALQELNILVRPHLRSQGSLSVPDEDEDEEFEGDDGSLDVVAEIKGVLKN